MLKLGGYLNILIGLGHLIGLFWADKMFEVTGIGEAMRGLEQIHSSLPFLLTIFASAFFFMFGLYGLSADGKFRKLSFLKPMIFIIAGIYLIRGVGELIFGIAIQRTNELMEIVYSLIAIFIGLLYLIGGIKKMEN
ncbi:MAG: hypothetical protein HC842_07475 [Cytophagales bacterium]|nr:hypothetical protein [Cytophagales bacterium]